VKFEIVAKTLFGLEDVLAGELEALGAENIKKLNRAVSFTGDNEMLYRANLHLRTAVKLLKPIHHFKAQNEQELYDAVYEYDWQQHFEQQKTFAIDSVVHSRFFNHSQFVSLRTKDAIADQFRNKTGRRPSVDTIDPDILINIRISEDECTLSLDSSGEPLFKRGYRITRDLAPLNEVLAAGMIMLSGWDKKSSLYDPMCGSGTLLIEVALLANNIPPGIFRKKFGFENWKDFDDELFSRLYNEEEPEPQYKPLIGGSDILPRVIKIAEKNVKNASLRNRIKLAESAIDSANPPEGPGWVVTNPPYGERLKQPDILKLYQTIGSSLKHKFSGYQAWILTSNRQALKQLGLHADEKFTLYNGSLECTFNKYELFSGKRRDFVTNK